MELDPGRLHEYAPPLAWTSDARHARVGAAEASRIAGIVITFTGVAFLGTGLGLIGWNETEISSTDAQLRPLLSRYASFMCGGLSPTDPVECERLEREILPLTEAQSTQDILRVVSIGSAVVGAAMVTLGVILWVGAPGERQIDESAHAGLSVGIGPGSLALRGVF
jgi:hypothetical protein